VSALLSVLYRLWSCRGCCLSGGIKSASLFFGLWHQKQTRRSRWWRSLYTGQSASYAAKPVYNARSYHLDRERCNTHSWHRDFVQRCVNVVPARVLRSAPLCLFTAAHPATSGEYCGWWLQSAGERLLRHCGSRVSAASSKIDWQLSYIQATLSCRQQTSRAVFDQTWISREPVYLLLWVLTKCWLTRYYPGSYLLTWVSHHQSAVCISV